MLLYVDANFASPYALVTFVSLVEKGLPFDIEALDLVAQANQDPGFAKTSITRRIPTLVHDGFALSESSAICEYLDETFPGTRLYPTDARDRARARQVQAWLRSDLIPIRDERPTFVVFCGAKRPALSAQAREAADRLFSAALTLLDGRTRQPFWRLVDRGCRSRDDVAATDRPRRPGTPTPHRIRDSAVASPDGATVDPSNAASNCRILTIDPKRVARRGFDAPFQTGAGDQRACRKGNDDGLTQQGRPPKSLVLGARTCALARLREPDALA